MTRHPTARRVHRQDTTPDDAFIAGVLESSAWAKQHSRKLIIGGIAAAVLITALVLFLMSRSNQRQQAIAQLTQVRATAISGNTPLAIQDLERYLAQYGGTPSADEARLLLGRAYLDNSQPAEARQTVERLAGDLDDPLGVNAAFLLAAAYEAAEEPHRAEEVYLRIADGAPFLFQQQDALDNAGRIRVQRGDAAGAVEIYERLVELTPEGNTERPVYELRLGEARAMVASASAGTTPPSAQPPAAPTTTGN